MAVTLLEIARVFATKVPGKIDADVLQLLWKVCGDNTVGWFLAVCCNMYIFLVLSNSCVFSRLVWLELDLKESTLLWKL